MASTKGKSVPVATIDGTFTKLAANWVVQTLAPIAPRAKALSTIMVTVAKADGTTQDIEVLNLPEWTNGEIWLYMPKSAARRSTYKPQG